jgi:multiple sugar transport system permease protein
MFTSVSIPAERRARRRWSRPAGKGRHLRAQPGASVAARRDPGRPARALRAAVLLVFAIFFGLPLLWLVLAPTRTDHELLTGPSFAFGSFHNVALAWQNLDSFGDHLYRRWLMNSLVYTLGATALTVATGIPAGYGLATGAFPGRRLILTLTLIAMLMPATALVLPIFLELNALHLIGSVFSVILPFAFFPFGVYLAYLYFATRLPTGVLDAARVDGCGEWQVFFRVALPLAKPIVALVFFFSFAADWNNFFLPYVVLPDSAQYPVEVGLSDLLVSASRPMLALAALIAALPVAVAFLVVHRALARGLVGDAAKS